MNKCPEGWKVIEKKMSGELIAGLHWLSVTVHTHIKGVLKIYEELLKSDFGELESKEGGFSGYENRYAGTDGFKIGYNIEYRTNFCTLFLPGAACEKLRLTFLKELSDLCKKEGLFVKCTRIDYAFDYCPFSVFQLSYMY